MKIEIINGTYTRDEEAAKLLTNTEDEYVLVNNFAASSSPVDRKSTRLNYSHLIVPRMPTSA